MDPNPSQSMIEIKMMLQILIILIYFFKLITYNEINRAITAVIHPLGNRSAIKIMYYVPLSMKDNIPAV